LVRAVATAAQASSVDRVVVTTGSETYAGVARNAGAETLIRPAELSTSEASSESALVHVLETIKVRGEALPEWLIFIQCTSPFTRINKFDYCQVLQQMLASGKTKALSGEKLTLESASSVNNLRVLRRYIQAAKSKRLLEVGLAYGASGLAILATQAENGGGSSHVAVDPLQSSLRKVRFVQS
jgi:CMP-2-keto-3-deoxyoctulosonic acid synthetase